MTRKISLARFSSSSLLRGKREAERMTEERRPTFDSTLSRRDSKSVSSARSRRRANPLTPEVSRWCSSSTARSPLFLYVKATEYPAPDRPFTIACPRYPVPPVTRTLPFICAPPLRQYAIKEYHKRREGEISVTRLTPDLPIIDVPYVAIDTETTGYSPFRGDRVVEIAALRFLRGNVIDRFSTLVNPLRPIPPSVTAIHGITDEMVREAPTFADIYDDLVSFLGDDVLVFHNAPFDLSFLRFECSLIGRRWVNNIVVCTLKLARMRRPGRSNKLQDLCELLGVGSPCHRAERDAHAAGRILLSLAAVGGEHLSLSELIALAGVLP
ncbi:MAG: 3'-5' exonuclease [Deltaproteobacteria bacterium]|nr:MAG: 3'-5' exonuclease [Deltaproteobacteria bacterium]